jgi:hypothetical protein
MSHPLCDEIRVIVSHRPSAAQTLALACLLAHMRHRLPFLKQHGRVELSEHVPSDKAFTKGLAKRVDKTHRVGYSGFLPKAAVVAGYTIKVNTRSEHRPMHVHVSRDGWEIRVGIGRNARFLSIKRGVPSNKEIKRAEELVQDNIRKANTMWRTHNGHL